MTVDFRTAEHNAQDARTLRMLKIVSEKDPVMFRANGVQFDYVSLVWMRIWVLFLWFSLVFLFLFRFSCLCFVFVFAFVLPPRPRRPRRPGHHHLPQTPPQANAGIAPRTYELTSF